MEDTVLSDVISHQITEQYRTKVGSEVDRLPGMLEAIGARMVALHERGDLHSLMVIRHIMATLNNVQRTLERNSSLEESS